MRIILIGYMGSGKTTIGRLLALYLKIKFYDLDDYISTQKKQSIQDIFLTKGENYFRKEEARSLRYLLKSKKKYVISSGGGTPCYENNIFLMKRLALTIYLRLSPKLIFQRLRSQKNNRPLIANLSDKELQRFIFQNLSQRINFYEQADYKVDITNKPPKEIVCYIQQQLLQFSS